MIKDNQAFKDYIALRDEAMINPTLENALNLRSHLNDDQINKFEPENLVAGLHKARFLWAKSTKAMLDESEEWLKSQGFSVPKRMTSKDFRPPSEIYNK